MDKVFFQVTYFVPENELSTQMDVFTLTVKAIFKIIPSHNINRLTAK